MKKLKHTHLLTPNF